MTSKKDMRRSDLGEKPSRQTVNSAKELICCYVAIPYVDPPKEKSEGDMSSKLPRRTLMYYHLILVTKSSN